jgi:hypothetical protein
VLGFELEEALSGSYYVLDAPLVDRAIRFQIRLGIDGLRAFLRDKRVGARGTLFAEGLAEGGGDGVPTTGHVTMRLFEERRVPYDLGFTTDEGRRFRLRGQRDFFMHDLVDSLTILPASLYDERGAEVGRATLRFDARRELPRTLRSLRPTFRPKFGPSRENDG